MSFNGSQVKLPRLTARVYRLLTKRERFGLLGLLFFALINVALETVGLGAVFAVVSVVVGGESLDALGPLSSAVGNLGRIGTVSITMAMLVVIFVLKHLVALTSFWYQQGLTNQITARIGQQLFRTLTAKPYEFYKRANTPDLIVKTQSASLLNSGLIGPSITLLVDLLVGVALVTLLIAIDPWSTAIVAILFGGFGIIFFKKFRSRISSWGSDQVTIRTESLRQLQDGFNAIKELRVLGREHSVVLRYRFTLERLGNLNQHFLTAQQIPRSALEVLSLVTVALLVVTLSVGGKSGDEVLPILALFAAGAFRVAPSINRVLTAFQQIQFSIPNLSMILDDIASPAILTSSPRQKDEFSFEALEFRDVTFCYRDSGDSVISNLSFELRRGETLGIIGESGVGKSTLIEIALGLLAPTTGSVRLNGQDLSSGLGVWYQNIGYVPQSILLIDDSIRRNVALGLDINEIDEAQVWEALRAAQLENFVRSLPSALDTTVGERGARLSGGQLQRLGIARALYHSPQVLFFDEATSSLDSGTEEALLDEIDELGNSISIIFVTHRQSALRICTRILDLSLS